MTLNIVLHVVDHRLCGRSVSKSSRIEENPERTCWFAAMKTYPFGRSHKTGKRFELSAV